MNINTFFVFFFNYKYNVISKTNYLQFTVYTRMEIFPNFRLTSILSHYILRPLWHTLYTYYIIDGAIVQVTAAATCSVEALAAAVVDEGLCRDTR